MFAVATKFRPAGRHRSPVAAAVALVAALTVFAAEASAESSACAPEPMAPATVRAASDGRVLELEDGRRLRLAGIETPDRGAQAHLYKVAAGREVRITRLGPDDRYGRIVAMVYPGDGPVSLQEQLLVEGRARVAGPIGNWACARLLLAAERQARASGRGLWSDPAHAPRRADKPQALRAALGRSILVDGRVLSVRPVGGIVYLNFSRRWTTGFTATVLKRNLDAFAQAGIALDLLAGRRVLVRGVLEERNGLRIELAGPEQIEISDP